MNALPKILSIPGVTKYLAIFLQYFSFASFIRHCTCILSPVNLSCQPWLLVGTNSYGFVVLSLCEVTVLFNVGVVVVGRCLLAVCGMEPVLNNVRRPLWSVCRSQHDSDVVAKPRGGQAFYTPLLVVYIRFSVLLPLVGQSTCWCSLGSRTVRSAWLRFLGLISVCVYETGCSEETEMRLEEVSD